MDIIHMVLRDFTWDTILKTGLRVTLILLFAWVMMKVLQKFGSSAESVGRFQDMET